MAKRKEQKPLENAIPLQDAFFAFCDPEIVARFQKAKQRRDGHAEAIDHEAMRRMGRVDVRAPLLKKETDAHLQALEKNFLEKLQGGVLTAWAREGSPLAPVQEIPVSAWSLLRLKSLPKNLAKGPHGDLYDVRIVNNAPTDAPPHEKKHGGRPPKMTEILAEYERRKKEGKCEKTLRSESFYLQSWSKKNFPDKETPSHRTIQNHLSRIGTDSSSKNK